MTITVIRPRSCRNCGERFHFADLRKTTRRELLPGDFKPPNFCPCCFSQFFGAEIAASFRRSTAEMLLIDSALAG